MKKLLLVLPLAGFIFTMSYSAFALNGSNVIGVGSTSRAMGGVGVAAPQDAASAVYNNPAAMHFGPFNGGSEAVYDLTFFEPSIERKISDPTGAIFGVPTTYTDKSTIESFLIPAVAMVTPVTSERFEKFKFGIAGYGFAGGGIDYRNSTLPSDVYVRLQVLGFTPAISYLLRPHFSIGASLHLVLGDFDLGNGSSHNYGLGGQVGVLYQEGKYSFGASYTSPRNVEHKKLSDFDLDGTLDKLDVASPQNIAVGVAVRPNDDFMVETNVKWYNWADAKGYKDFDFDNQWVFALGIQYEPNDEWKLRAGFNYGEHPVKDHTGFNPLGTTDVQGKTASNISYELLRITGFPVILEKHVTIGAGHELSDTVSVNFSYLHGFEETISETDALGLIGLESTVKLDAVGVGLSFRF